MGSANISHQINTLCQNQCKRFIGGGEKVKEQKVVLEWDRQTERQNREETRGKKEAGKVREARATREEQQARNKGGARK